MRKKTILGIVSAAPFPRIGEIFTQSGNDVGLRLDVLIGCRVEVSNELIQRSSSWEVVINCFDRY